MLLPALSDLAEIIVSYKRTDYESDLKSDGSPVTSADLYFNDLLFKYLPRISNLPIVSEESRIPPLRVRKQWPNYWLIDPIDGTKGFIEGSVEWTVNVALIQQNKVVMGLIVAPELNQAWLGMNGKGCFKYVNEIWSELQSEPKVALSSKGVVRILGSVHHPESELKHYLEENESAQLISVGSSLKFCWIAEGKADWYPRYSRLSEWDIAAGHGIVKSMGGNVYLMGTKEEHLYNSEDLKTKPFEVY